VRRGIGLLIVVGMLAGCAGKPRSGSTTAATASPASPPAPTPSIPAGVNAAAIYREAYGLLPRDPAERERLEDTDGPLDDNVRRVVRDCHPALAAARAARSVSSCDFEVVGMGVGRSPRNESDFKDVRYLARAMTLSARLHLADRQEAEALESLTDAFWLVRRMQAVPAIMWRYSGYGMEDGALRAAARFAVLASPASCAELRRRFMSLPPTLPVAEVLRADAAATALQFRSDWTKANGRPLAEGDEPFWMRRQIDEINRYTERVIAMQSVPWAQYDEAVTEMDKEMYASGIGQGAAKVTKALIPPQWAVRKVDERVGLTRAQFLAGTTLILEGEPAFARAVDPIFHRPFMLTRLGKGFLITPTEHFERQVDDSFPFPAQP